MAFFYRVKGEEVVGVIDATPKLVNNVNEGQKYKLPLSSITDWMYIKDGRIHGNYTMRVLLPYMNQEDANVYRNKLAPLPDFPDSDFNMSPDKRERLRKHTVDFLKSKEFSSHMNVLLDYKGTEKQLLRFQKDFVRNLKDAPLEMGYLWMVNSGLTQGNLISAPGLMVIGAKGTEESEKYVQHVYEKLGNLDSSDTPQKVKDKIRAMLSDENFKLGRGRKLPLEFTEGYPVYLVDTLLSSDTIKDPEGNIVPFVPCLFTPPPLTTIFAIPLPVAAQMDSSVSPYTPNPIFDSPENPPLPPHEKRGSGAALASMICGIIAFLTGGIFIGAVPGILALILGGFALNKISKSQGRITGKSRAIIGLICGGISVIYVAFVLSIVLTSDKGKSNQKVLDAAIHSVRFPVVNELAYGNSPTAKSMAEDFSLAMFAFQESLMTNSDGEFKPRDNEVFPTHCELRENSCAFICKIPRIALYTEKGKEMLRGKAWHVASQLAKERGVPEGFSLSVSVHGIMNFDSIDIGKLDYATTPTDSLGKYLSDKSNTDTLEPFFSESNGD